LANPVSPNQLDGKASNSSLIERIRQIDAKKVEVKGESTNQYSKPSSDPRKQTIILGGRQLGYHSTYNRESDTTIMKQEIENSERERSRLAREAKEVHLREQQQREEEKRRKENIVKKELALREEARKEEEEKMKEKQADLAVGKSNIKRKRKQIQDEKIRQQLKNDEKVRLKVQLNYSAFEQGFKSRHRRRPENELDVC
jgi:hypothetical protein